MAATATRPLGASPRPTPVPISDAVREMLADERRRMQSNPEPKPVPADITTDSTYLFRSNAGIRRIRHQLPMPPEESTYGDEKEYRFRKRRWDATVAARWYPDLPRDEAAAKVAEELEALRDEIGDTKFKFSQVTRRQECYLATNSDRLAAYIRRLMAERKGEFATVYEVNPRARIVVGDQAFPNTETGKRLALAYAEQQGITDIKFIKE